MSNIKFRKRKQHKKSSRRLNVMVCTASHILGFRDREENFNQPGHYEIFWSLTTFRLNSTHPCGNMYVEQRRRELIVGNIWGKKKDWINS